MKSFDQFEFVYIQIAEEWMEYITKLDRLIEEALCNCAKNSYKNVYDTLHGSGTIEPLRLIRLELDLNGNRVRVYIKLISCFYYIFPSIAFQLHFTPSINDLSKTLIGLFELVTSSLRQFPRLFDKFKLPKRNTILDYHRSINLRGDIEQLKTFITNEVVFNQQQMDEYLEQWKPFKALWEMDKDLFMRKFNEMRIEAKSFEKNFTRYAEIENQVLLQEGMGVIQFVEINANQLKNSIFGHIDDWKERHRMTLRKSGYSQITGRWFFFFSFLFKIVFDQRPNFSDLYNYMTNNAKKILKPPTNLKQMQEALNLYKVLSDACSEKETDIVEVKDHFEVMGT